MSEDPAAVENPDMCPTIRTPYNGKETSRRVLKNRSTTA